MSWKDFFKQIDRFDGSFRQLKKEGGSQFQKHFGDIKNSLAFMLADKLEKPSTLESLGKFLLKDTYSLLSKLAYLGIICYQLYITPIKWAIKPVKNANFKREVSTLE